MYKKSIPFNRVSFDSGEMARVQEAVESGHISGDGPFSKKVEKILSDMHDGSRVLLTPSCSHALELAARLIGFEEGDEIIVPSFTFVTTVSSFVSEGATPVYCDIDPITLGLDLDEVRKLITPKTKAIVLVHYGGLPANPEGFSRLAEDHGLILIEDNAHGLGGTSNGRKLGTFGAMSTLSFHETKNITCGEGGALVINDPHYTERAEILREKGTDRSRFFRGQVDKYTWQDSGSSWVLPDILAAVLYAQLSDFLAIQERREERWGRYDSALKDWVLARGYDFGPPGSGTSHLFYLLFPHEYEQSAFREHMSSHGVTTVFHYQALHKSPYGSQFDKKSSTLQTTERVAAGLVRLPLFAGLTKKQQDWVVRTTLSFQR
jgi:dTDP-4-amino-4,6-dideoxygalactose transaminase